MNKEERLQLENECLMKYSKAQMIEKYIGELEENSKLSELWCKSQQENQKYKEVFDKLIKSIDDCWYMDSENVGEQVFLKKCELKDILKEVSE